MPPSIGLTWAGHAAEVSSGTPADSARVEGVAVRSPEPKLLSLSPVQTKSSGTGAPGVRATHAPLAAL